MSSEKSPNNSERWWSYDTPYDIVHRRELVEKDETRRVQDIDNYIAFINEDMADNFKAITYIDERTDRALRHYQSNGTRVYRRNIDGLYEPHAYITSMGRFFADEAIVDGEDVVLLNHELGIGVTPFESVKLININPDSIDSYKYHRRHKLFGDLIESLVTLKKDERRYKRSWDSPYDNF